MTISDAQDRVRAFHRTMVGPRVTPDSPTPLSEYDGELRCRLIEEEAAEFRLAWMDRDRVRMIDGLCDLLYVTLGAAVQMGIDLEPFFEEVHQANMRKAGGRLRADGKYLKPEGWTPPDIEGTYRRVYGTRGRV